MPDIAATDKPVPEEVLAKGKRSQERRAKNTADREAAEKAAQEKAAKEKAAGTQFINSHIKSKQILMKSTTLLVLFSHAMTKFDTPLNLIDQEVYGKWLKQIESYDLENDDSAVKNIVSALYNSAPCFVVRRFSGSFNFCFLIHFEDQRNDMILRFPIHGVVMNPQKKVEDEANVMRFIQEKTSIPIPKYHTHGIASGEFSGLGPYILMEFIPGQRLDELLCSDDKFKPTVTEWQFRKVYEQIAAAYQQLWNLEFEQIGRLSWDEQLEQWCVKPDPSTIKQNMLECQGIKVPEIQLPQNTSSFMLELIDQSMLGLWDKSYVADEATCRDRYLSLMALRAVTPQVLKDKFLYKPKLFNPDLRLGNMIADSRYNVTFLDWEFCYVGPAQFLYGSPLGVTPLDMISCTDEEWDAYRIGVDKFITVLREKDTVLSGLMEESMKNGTFWYNQAVQEPDPHFWSDMVKRLWTFLAMPDVQDPLDMAKFTEVKMEQYRKKWNL